MAFTKMTPDNLMQQIIYICIELPTRILVNLMSRVTNSIRSYTQCKPMLRLVNKIMLSTSYRLSILGNYTDQFSFNTQSFIISLLNINKKFALCITNCIIRSGKAFKQEFEQIRFLKSMHILFISPFLIAKHLVQNFNYDFNKKQILQREDYSSFIGSFKKYASFCLELCVAFFMLPIPQIKNQKIIVFKEKLKSMQEPRVRFRTRAIISTLLFSVLFVLLYYRDSIIDVSLSAATHFNLVALLTVSLVSLVMASSKGLMKFMIINITCGLIFCWFCSPVISALS